MNRKVLLITNIPTPYRIPLFNVLHEELSQRGIDFSVVFGALGYARRKWKINLDDCRFPTEVLPTANLRFSDPERASFTYNGLLRVLRRKQPALIVTNGFSIATTKLWLRSLFRRTPYLIWSGAISHEDNSQSFRRWQRKMLVRRASGFIAYGSLARDYLVELGAPPEKVEIGINTVDTSYYAAAARGLTNHAAPKELVYVGHLPRRKRVDQILQIVKKLSEKRNDFVLRIIGSGEEEESLKALSAELSLEHLVRFEGFKQKEDVARFLAGAYCFLFPTNFDIWGLVLVEAMAAGVPSLSSIHAGATHDLIQCGQNGFAVDFSNTESVTEILDRLLENPEERDAMAQRARTFIEQHATLNQSAAGFVRAIESALAVAETK